MNNPSKSIITNVYREQIKQAAFLGNYHALGVANEEARWLGAVLYISPTELEAKRRDKAIISKIPGEFSMASGGIPIKGDKTLPGILYDEVFF